MLNRTRKKYYVLSITVVMIAAVAMGWIIAKRFSDLSATAPGVSDQIAIAPAKQAVHLYFSNIQGRYLNAEQRVMDVVPDPGGVARQLVEALIEGPQKGSNRTLPAQARLRAAYLTDDGTAYLDFAADAFSEHPGGAVTELLSIYSIVNTLVLNVEAIRYVKFLIGGQEAATLAGHVDLQYPFTANMLWVR